MPLCRRKRVLLVEPSPALLDAVKTDPNKEVFYLRQTGEIFETYDEYASRMSFYKVKQFQCEVTGKSGLDYFQALESEHQEARTMHSRFPEPLKGPVLKAVQWQVMGRLDHLVEAVYDRFKDRYFNGEKVLVDFQGEKYSAKVIKVFPPTKYPPRGADEDTGEKRASTSASPSESSLSPVSDEEPVHVVASDLKVSVKDSIVKDDPNMYVYRVQILEEEKSEKSKSAARDAMKSKMSGAIRDVQPSSLSRDRLAFSKSILRRFMRECVDRAPAVASPWTVKPSIAEKYGVSSIMPEETRKGVENLKNKEIEKRKKVWEDKEGPPSKKQKKPILGQEDNMRALADAAERREQEAKEAAEKKAREEEEKAKKAEEKIKKKPIRYPTEDLDVRLGDKEKKAGMKIKRPVPSRTALPFGEDRHTFEMFLMAWNFLVVYGQPLHLSSFTLDEFEHALQHPVADPACPLLGEIHSTLIYNLRTVPFVRHNAIMSLLDLKENIADGERPDDRIEDSFGVPIATLVDAVADVGNNWERVPLRATEGREGWEDALVGCLKDHADINKLPRLRAIFTQLLFSPESSREPSPSTSASPRAEATVTPLTRPSRPRERYHALPPRDRIAILAYMCNLAVSSKAIHMHMESCEENLTALRKEKIEVNRTKKAYLEEMEKLNAATNENDKATAANGTDGDAVIHESSELSDAPSDGGSDSGTASRRESKHRYQSLASARLKAKKKEEDRKHALAEHRRLDEEVNKLERRLEGIEREFRKLLGAIRVKPLGRDRFFNRIWWFDGMGSGSLLASGGSVQYGTGRIFVQGPSEFDAEILGRRDEKDVLERRFEEEGEEGMLGVGEWAVYNTIEEVDEFVAWLNPKGVRELALKNAFTKWWPHINPGIRKRMADLGANAKAVEARRSSRSKVAATDLSREPYMMWTNRRATNGS
ncbi:hypothetical protein GLOTRDRAFT_135465 [Gloeophyllum trabeum ATCC 11539]|uniref:Chromatin remodeling complex protein n=1 Tax=Gloeophyllum trabeum (strain ATCC 11539 / FP-39264 / Madison 617) TaxID=670483 RepID=S7S0I0_GLOTA|nr:uncharacterized protein GLOTRDRAFT_135465 [Gloeophyllum trabeum ATCC 11539]EPQ60860.1 hypothetical protein GLOTRDRAFT_135465 [Gloeophyllum trabeum ATCC 11539]